MFTNKKLILAATVAAQVALASDLLWFEEEAEDPEEAALLEGDDADLTEAEREEELRMLGRDRHDPSKRFYFHGSNGIYKNASRQDKMKALWGQLVPDVNNHDTEPSEYWYGKFPQFFTNKAQVSFCNNSDEIRKNRFKTTHTQGLVAKVEWVPTEEAKDQGYTGMMNTGSDHIIMRLSETNNLDEDTSPGLLPSMALKFLRDDDMSYNMFAMPSFKTTDSWNWFQYPMSNVVEPFNKEDDKCEIRTQLKKMVEANQRPFGTGISDIARCNFDGTTLDNADVKVPYRLQFTSSIDFPHEQEWEEDENGEDRWVMWYEQLQRIPEDSTIYEVYGWTAPEKLDGELIKIADLKLRSALYASDFGDNRLFFRHQSIAKDRKFWPRAWRRLREDTFISKKKEENVWGNEVPDTWPADEDEAKDMYDDQIETFGCPFQWLIPNDEEILPLV